MHHTKTESRPNSRHGQQTIRTVTRQRWAIPLHNNFGSRQRQADRVVVGGSRGRDEGLCNKRQVPRLRCWSRGRRETSSRRPRRPHSNSKGIHTRQPLIRVENAVGPPARIGGALGDGIGSDAPPSEKIQRNYHPRKAQLGLHLIKTIRIDNQRQQRSRPTAISLVVLVGERGKGGDCWTRDPGQLSFQKRRRVSLTISQTRNFRTATGNCQLTGICTSAMVPGLIIIMPHVSQPRAITGRVESPLPRSRGACRAGPNWPETTRNKLSAMALHNCFVPPSGLGEQRPSR